MTSLPARTKSESAAAVAVEDFLAEKRASAPRPICRLIFALDATASRQETWDTAAQLQGEMFREVMSLGGISIQLVYYRDYDECKSSGWETRSEQISKLMGRIVCRAGLTQIGRILDHAQKETRLQPVQAMVFVGDAMEEKRDALAHRAGILGSLGVPVFAFQEGDDPKVEQAFREIARLTNGAYGRFDTGAAKQLSDLLKAVAAFAAGGLTALAGRKDDASTLLLGQMK